MVLAEILSPPDSPADFAAKAGLVVLSLAVVMAFVRLAIGPTLPDRVVALDVISILLTGLLVVHSIADENPDSLQVALVLALINFVATVGFAAYVWKKAQA